MEPVSDDRFGEFIEEALAALPPELAGAIDNVAIVIEDEAEGRDLYGLYHGVPLTKRTSYGATPDKISIYKTTICEHCTTEQQVREQVRRTVIHEIGHHFGISDSRLRELGW